jgi:hypothetical protein
MQGVNVRTGYKKISLASSSHRKRNEWQVSHARKAEGGMTGRGRCQIPCKSDAGMRPPYSTTL